MEFVNEVLVPALAVIVTGLATWGVAVLTNWLNSKIKNEQLRTTLKNARDIIMATVAETSQLFVDDLKKENLFTEEAKAEAYKLTLEKVKAQLTDKAKTAIQTVTNDLDLWLEAEIEKAVKNSK